MNSLLHGELKCFQNLRDDPGVRVEVADDVNTGSQEAGAVLGSHHHFGWVCQAALKPLPSETPYPLQGSLLFLIPAFVRQFNSLYTLILMIHLWHLLGKLTWKFDNNC